MPVREDVEQHHVPVGVLGIGRRPDRRRHLSGHLDRLRERLRREHEHIVSRRVERGVILVERLSSSRESIRKGVGFAGSYVNVSAGAPESAESCRARRHRRSCSRCPPEARYQLVGYLRERAATLLPSARCCRRTRRCRPVARDRRRCPRPSDSGRTSGAAASRVDARLRSEFAGDVVDALVRARPHHEADKGMARDLLSASV